jgi:hypothetical protein
LVHKYEQYLYVLALATIAPRQGTCPHHQAYWLSAKKTPSTEKVFLITSQMPVLAPAQYKKKLLSFEQLSSLYSICAAGIVFLKTSLSLSRALRAFARQTAPRCRFYSTATTLALLPYAVVNKSLQPSASIGPSLVLCLIHCRSPTPSAFYFALQS